MSIVLDGDSIGSVFFVEIELYPPPIESQPSFSSPSDQQQDHSSSATSPYQPIRSQSRSRCDVSRVSHVDDQDTNNDIEEYDDGVLVSSATSSLNHYKKRKPTKSNQSNQSNQSTTSSIPVVPYLIEDVMLKSCLYAGSPSQSTENMLNEINLRCKQIHYPKSDGEIITMMTNALISLKTINLLVLDTDRNASLTSSVLMAKLRKLGYCGFAVLLSSENFPDTNERFLNCGGDGILWKPIKNIKAIQRVLIGNSIIIHSLIFIRLFSFIYLFN